MKILILCDKMDIGGAETHIVALCDGLLQFGCHITALCAGGAYIERLKKMGVVCVTAPTDKRTPTAIYKCFSVIRKEMRRQDVIHAHTRFTSFIARVARGRSSYPPIAVTAHLPFLPPMIASLSFFGDATLAVSEDIACHLSECYGIDRSAITVTVNGIGREYFIKKGKREKLIIHVSRLDKGRSASAKLLLSIAPKLLCLYPCYKILIVGGGNEFELISAECKRINEKLAREAVIALGPRTDIPEILSRGEIFVGASRALLEALAAGISAILCGDEGYGGILTPENFSELARTNFCARDKEAACGASLFRDIEVLITSPALRSRIADGCRAFVAKDYTPMRMACDAIATYSAIKGTPRVCLMGYFGYSNLGDEITLGAAREALIRLGIEEISVISARKTGKKRGGVYLRWLPTDILLAINRCDIFVLCGGNLLQNETSRRSLFYYELIIRLAKAMGKRIYMLSSGFGATYGKLGLWLMKCGILAADLCGCRTEYDLKIARSAGSACASLMPDLCFLLYDEKFKKELTVNKYFIYIPRGRAELSIDELKRIQADFHLRAIVVFLNCRQDIHHTKTYFDAGISCYFPKSYREVNKILNGAAFTITERLHGAVFSLLAHTPSYYIGNSVKLAALAEEVSHACSELLMPFASLNTRKIKEIGAQDSDFKNVIISFKRQTEVMLRRAFGIL